MKKVYEDKHYEAVTLQEVEKTREAVQKVLDQWNALKLTPIDSASELYDLIVNPELLIQEAAMGRKMEDGTDIPGSVPIDPLSLYDAARAAKRLPFASREHGLFSVKGKKVVTNEPAADKLANARTVYANNPAQEKFAADVQTFTEVFNLINSKMGGRLVTVPAFRTAWSQLLILPPEDYSDTIQYPASFKLERLKEIINQIA